MYIVLMYSVICTMYWNINRDRGFGGKGDTMTEESKKVPGKVDTFKRLQQNKFLAGLKEKGTIRNGMRMAGVSRRKYNSWMADDPQFAEKALDARQEFAETLEEVIVGIVMDPEAVKKVPVLAITLLNANLPNKYRPTAIVQDETARDLLREWRKHARQNPKSAGDAAEESNIPVEQQVDDILKGRQ